ncbi:hypothetical protein F4778DRAFT_721309 [Xylariomycetidae sp. FL2044]|nr:hypothetical protein F4778DRAFT_721309 [Xylariomycetidae sp. FL2044]
MMTLLMLMRMILILILIEAIHDDSTRQGSLPLCVGGCLRVDCPDNLWLCLSHEHPVGLMRHRKMEISVLGGAGTSSPGFPPACYLTTFIVDDYGVG